MTGTVAVIGAGAVGLACALNLRRAGGKVTVFDQDSSTPTASAGNAGHIAIEQVEPQASPSGLRGAIPRLFIWGGPLDFRLRDAVAWAPWALSYIGASSPEKFAAGRTALGSLLADSIPAWRRLLSSIEEPSLLLEQGHLVVWESPRSASAGRRKWSNTDTGQTRFRAIDAQDVASLAEHLKAPLSGGIRFSGTAQISDPSRLLERLKSSLASEGVEIKKARAEALSVVEGRASFVTRQRESSAWDLIVVTAGVGSGALMQGAGHRAPIIAERGYHIEGPADEWPDLPPVVFEDRAMIVSRFDQRLRAAGFVEFGRADSPPDPRKWKRLRQHVQELGLPMRQPYSQWVGARPTLPDYLPAIGVSSLATNLIYAFGHQHLGLTLAATTGEIVTRIANGCPTDTDIAPFSLDRFNP